MRHARRQFGPIAVDRLTQRHALARVQGLMRVGAGGMVLTPGANDIVLAHRVPRLREAYKRVSMSIPDAATIGSIARFAGVKLPERVTKAAFMGPLMDLAAAEGWGVFLIGPCTETTQAATARIEARHAGLRVVGTDCSVWKGTPDQALVRRILDSGARLVIVALPSPRQEMWMLQHTAMLAPAITFGIGETMQTLGKAELPRESVLGRLGRAVLTLRVLSVLMKWRFGTHGRRIAKPAVPARPWVLKPLPPSRSR
jgi:N-acetylglucosaminyldiphosphoundecaprenol N-acetyl-beta-D-mannosaminyltransferase